MVGPAMDLLNNPLGAVKLLFEKQQDAAASHELGSNDWGVAKLVEEVLIGQGRLHKVPELNSTQPRIFKSNKLVRYRGMVQDMLNQEYFIGMYKDESGRWQTTKFSDVADIPSGAENSNHVWERRLLFCVPVPGESEWCREAWAPSTSDQSATEVPPPSGSAGSRAKRQRDGADEVMADELSPSEEPETADAKRQRESEENIGGSNLSSSAMTDLNIPFGDGTKLPCLVKTYDNSDAELKLGDVVEFVGIATFDPELWGPQGPGDSMEADVNASLPPSQVPRLQCLYLRKLSSAVPQLLEPSAEEAARKELLLHVRELRASLLRQLQALLGGDSLAAEYLLLNMLGGVRVRVEPLALGHLSLNLFGFGAEVSAECRARVEALGAAIGQLLPRAAVLPLDLDTLNKRALVPKKDYTTNRLLAGSLQLAEGTHLTCDETVMKTGQLNNTGVQNLRSLHSVLQWQKVEYDFEFYQMPMQTDIGILVLSQGKSMLPTDISLPVRETTSSQRSTVDESSLQQWRLYLSLVRRLNHSLSTDISEGIEADLVAARRLDNSVGQETFHRWLTMARLHAASFGEEALTMERWQEVRAMENIREARCRCC